MGKAAKKLKKKGDASSAFSELARMRAKKPSERQLAARKAFAVMAKARAKKKSVKTKKVSVKKKVSRAKKVYEICSVMFASKHSGGKASGKKYYLQNSGKLDTVKGDAQIFHKGDAPQLKTIAKCLVKKLPVGYALFTETVKRPKK